MKLVDIKINLIKFIIRLIHFELNPENVFNDPCLQHFHYIIQTVNVRSKNKSGLFSIRNHYLLFV